MPLLPSWFLPCPLLSNLGPNHVISTSLSPVAMSCLALVGYLDMNLI